MRFFLHVYHGCLYDHRFQHPTIFAKGGDFQHHRRSIGCCSVKLRETLCVVYQPFIRSLIRSNHWFCFWFYHVLLLIFVAFWLVSRRCPQISKCERLGQGIVAVWHPESQGSGVHRQFSSECGHASRAAAGSQLSPEAPDGDDEDYHQYDSAILLFIYVYFDMYIYICIYIYRIYTIYIYIVIYFIMFQMGS